VWVARRLGGISSPPKNGEAGGGEGRKRDGAWMERRLVNEKNLSPQQWGGKWNTTRQRVGSTLPRHCHPSFQPLSPLLYAFPTFLRPFEFVVVVVDGVRTVMTWRLASAGPRKGDDVAVTQRAASSLGVVTWRPCGSSWAA